MRKHRSYDLDYFMPTNMHSLVCNPSLVFLSKFQSDGDYGDCFYLNAIP